MFTSTMTHIIWDELFAHVILSKRVDCWCNNYDMYTRSLDTPIIPRIIALD